jgi:hypothetical protein
MLLGCFLGFLPFFKRFIEPILCELISNPPSLYGINLKRLVKIPGYRDEFVEFSLYEKSSGNPRFIKWRTRVWRHASCLKKFLNI